MKNRSLVIIEKIVFCVCTLSILGVIIAAMCLLPGAPESGAVVGNISNKTRSDYTLILVMGIPSFVLMFLPMFVKKKFHIEIPVVINIIYDLFFFCAVVLGEFFSFYYRFDAWDSVLHFTSAVLFTFLAYTLITRVIGEERAKAHPWMVVFFAFTIAETCGVMWELCEFTMDSFGLNSQKYQDGNGVDLIGRLALMDTMGDIIVNTAGTVTANIAGIISLKHEQTFFDSVLIRKMEVEESYDNYISSRSIWSRK